MADTNQFSGKTIQKRHPNVPREFHALCSRCQAAGMKAMGQTVADCAGCRVAGESEEGRYAFPVFDQSGRRTGRSVEIAGDRSRAPGAAAWLRGLLGLGAGGGGGRG